MLSAREMCALATSSAMSPILCDIEEKMKKAASDGCFFIKLFDLEIVTSDAQYAVIDKYGSEIYRTLERLDYVFSIYEGSVYVGFAYSDAKIMISDIRNQIKQ